MTSHSEEYNVTDLTTGQVIARNQTFEDARTTAMLHTNKTGHPSLAAIHIPKVTPIPKWHRHTPYRKWGKRRVRKEV
jgi:hypothetical protein